MSVRLTVRGENKPFVIHFSDLNKDFMTKFVVFVFLVKIRCIKFPQPTSRFKSET